MTLLPDTTVPDFATVQRAFDAINNGALGGPSFATSITGDGATTQFTVTHNLGTNDVHVTVYANAAPKADVIPTIDRPSASQVRLTFGAAPAVGLVYRVVVSS